LIMLSGLTYLKLVLKFFLCQIIFNHVFGLVLKFFLLSCNALGTVIIKTIIYDWMNELIIL